jgi:protein phosphatase
MGPGEILLICSDGLTTMVPAHKIETILAEAAGDIESAAAALVAAANAQGGEDNITVVLLKFEE